jgi:hypothetical protein
VRVVQLSVQPRSWLGRLALALAGAGAMVIAFFLSIVAFLFVAGLVSVAFIYLFWVTRRLRRAMREQVIEGQVQSREIR